MFKLILKVEGVKRKEQKIKVHNLPMGYARNINKEEFKSVARSTIESNMKTSNRAVLFAFRAEEIDGQVVEVEKVPSYTFEL